MGTYFHSEHLADPLFRWGQPLQGTLFLWQHLQEAGARGLTAQELADASGLSYDSAKRALRRLSAHGYTLTGARESTGGRPQKVYILRPDAAARLDAQRGYRWGVTQ